MVLLNNGIHNIAFFIYLFIWWFFVIQKEVALWNLAASVWDGAIPNKLPSWPWRNEPYNRSFQQNSAACCIKSDDGQWQDVKVGFLLNSYYFLYCVSSIRLDIHNAIYKEEALVSLTWFFFKLFFPVAFLHLKWDMRRISSATSNQKVWCTKRFLKKQNKMCTFNISLCCCGLFIHLTTFNLSLRHVKTYDIFDSGLTSTDCFSDFFASAYLKRANVCSCSEVY